MEILVEFFFLDDDLDIYGDCDEPALNIIATYTFNVSSFNCYLF